MAPADARPSSQNDLEEDMAFVPSHAEKRLPRLVLSNVQPSEAARCAIETVPAWHREKEKA